VERWGCIVADLPIIYLRGWAGSKGAVESTVADPFYGFNVGSMHIRVAPDGDPEYFAFESPLVRLMTDHGYVDAYHRGRQPEEGDDLDPHRETGSRSIWIFRYYDVTSRRVPGPGSERPEIEQHAEALAVFIEHIKTWTGAPKVVLVGHSTGGLIARSLIQRHYPEKAGWRPGPHAPPPPATEHIDKVFTYGAPHGGIQFDVPGGGLLERARDLLGRNNMDDFGPRRLRQFLLPRDWPEVGEFDPQSLYGTFPPERFFSVVGTNARDYEVAFGASAVLAGPQSDGLVQIRNAYVRGGPRAYVHRAHSGPYGLVNSEEGYQNLRRFLFGTFRVELAIDGLGRLRELPPESGLAHSADVQVSIRQLPVLMHDQQVSHHSPILLELEKAKQDQPPIALFTTYLIPSLAPDERLCRYAVRLAVYRERRARRAFSLRDHLEQVPIWVDHLVVDLEAHEDGSFSGRYGWQSQRRTEDEPLPDEIVWADEDEDHVVTIPVPEVAQERLGDDTVVIVRASPWT
jgi:pimeloyl-ACP methyl ester carboxylesterase